MRRYIKHLINSAEQRVDKFLESQISNPDSHLYGGIRSSIWEAKPTIYMMANAVALYLNRESKYYQDQRLYDAMLLALQFIRNTQRDDGSFDYPSCNFKSAADTSFCFKRLAAAYRLMQQQEPTQELYILQMKYLVIMKDALKAIYAGGFHTPNHRWAIAAALLQGARFFERETAFAKRLKIRAEDFLAEGIDIDEDGEYAERSTGNYNAVVNNSMMTLYEETGDRKYFEIVKKNLEMMQYYIDPDDTIFTQNSTRQDNGCIDFADKYFYQYCYICAHEQQSDFDGIAHKIIKDNLLRGDMAPECLHIIMGNQEMLNYRFRNYGFLAEYRKYFQHSGLLRVKKPQYTYTVIKQKSAFLFFKHKESQIYFKIGESYCDIRNFIPTSMKVEQGRTILQATAEGWYYLPFKAPPETSDWWKMDHSRREKLVSSTLTIEVVIEEKEKGLDLTLKSTGLDRLPLRVEVGIASGAAIENQYFWLEAHAGGEMIFREGNLTIVDHNNEFLLKNGFGEHDFKGHYSGEERNDTGFTIFMNAYTPCEKQFSLYIK